MTTLILHPENEEQLNALKVIASALHVKFETSDSTYDPVFVAEVLEGDKARKAGKKGLRVDVNDLWK